MQQRPIFALVLRLAAALSFATMALLIKLAGESGASLPQIMVWRQLVPVPALLGYLWLTGGLGQLRTRRLAAMPPRTTIGMLGMVCNFGAVLLLPLAEATVLGFTAPLFAVTIGALVLREHVGAGAGRRWRWALPASSSSPSRAASRSRCWAPPALGAGLCVAVVSFQIRDLARSEASIAIVSIFPCSARSCRRPPAVLAGRHARCSCWCCCGIGLAGTLGASC